MKRTAIACVLVLCLCLSGCSSLLTGQFMWEQDHYIPPMPDSNQEQTAADYNQLVGVLTAAIGRGEQTFTVSVAQYDRAYLETDASKALGQVWRTDPVAAYAVEDITCQIGTSAGETVLLVQVAYRHDSEQISKIQTVANNEAARQAIVEALKNCETGIVLRINSYEAEDFRLAAELCALYYPHYVMEAPQVSVNTYPNNGTDRVVDIRFTYVNSRESLLNMQSQVLKLIDGSMDIVGVAETSTDKYTQLYALLVERFQKYTIETSITQAYSLLLHGVGDARAFAVVYSAMCHEAGLSCEVVAGTRSGKLWYWNIVQVDGVYYHVDLLRSKGEGKLRLLTDNIINEGYVWDFSSYPTCGER